MKDAAEQPAHSLADDVIHIADPNLRLGFAQVPRPVLRAKRLGDKAKVLYALLLDYAWQQGSCFPGQRRLADDLGTTERTIRRALDELRHFRLITCKRRGLSQTNIYVILSLAGNPHLSIPEVDRTSVSAQDRTPTSHKEDPEERGDSLRSSNGNASEREGTQLNQTDTYSPRAVRSASPPGRRRGDFTSLRESLSDRLNAVAAAHSAPATRIPEQLAACLEDISNQLGDRVHLRSNVTQALRLQRDAGLPENIFVSRLYEALAITKDRRSGGGSPVRADLIRPMAYFWRVVRDQLHLIEGAGKAITLPGGAGASRR